MFFDMQFSQAKFGELLRDQVERVLPLVTTTFDVPPFAEPLLIDHLDVASISGFTLQAATIAINTPGGSSNISGNKIRINIGITAKLALHSDVIAAGHLGIPNTFAFPLTVVADISASTAGGMMTLNIAPVSISTNGALTAAQEQGLLALLPSLNCSLPLPNIAGTVLTVSNAGVTAHAGVIAILAEISAPSNTTLQAWKNFFAGKFLARPGDWSILLPPDFIANVVNAAVTDAVDLFPENNPDVEIVKEPTSIWNGAGVSSVATINAVDACPVFNLDIEVDLTFNVSFALANGSLKGTIDVSWDLNDWDVFVCGLASVVLPGAVVTVIVGAIAGPIGAVIAAVATIILFIVALVVISDKAHGQLSDGVSGLDPGSLDLHTVSQDSDHAVIEGHVDIGGLMQGMVPTSVAATPFGLQISGTLDVPAHQERSLHTVSQSKFGWDSGYSCSKSSWGTSQIEAMLGMTEPADYPIQAKVDVLAQPPNSYVPKLTMWAPVTGFGLSIYSTLPANTLPDCELLIWTNSGVRYANFGHLPKEPAAPSSEQIIEGKIGCMKQVLPGPKKWLEAHWLVDPPPYDKVIDQVLLWDVVASKVQAGAIVELAVVGVRGDVQTLAKLQAGGTEWRPSALRPRGDSRSPSASIEASKACPCSPPAPRLSRWRGSCRSPAPWARRLPAQATARRCTSPPRTRCSISASTAVRWAARLSRRMPRSPTSSLPAAPARAQ